MPIRFYLMDKVVVTAPSGSQTGQPEYPMPAGSRSQVMDYGTQPHCLVAVDTTIENHAALAANADVDQFPADLDSDVGAGNLESVQNVLEARNLPGDAVVAAASYRRVLRGVVVIFLIAQRFSGIAKAGGGNRNLFSNVNLETTIGQIPATRRQWLIQAIDELGYDRTGITNATTIRQALNILTAQAAPVPFLGETI